MLPIGAEFTKFSLHTGLSDRNIFFPDNKILKKAVTFLQLLLNMPFRVVGAEGVEPPTLCL